MEKIKLYQQIFNSIRCGDIPQKPKEFSEEEWIYYLKEEKIPGLCKKNGLNATQESTNKMESEIKKEYFKLMMLNHYRKNEAKRIIKAQNSKGIIPVILKGIYMQEYIYPKGEIRFSNDIDLYVPKKDEFNKSVEIIVNLGYKKYVYRNNLWQEKFSKGVTFLRIKNDDTKNFLNIDLHKKILFCSCDKRSHLNIPFEQDEFYEYSDYDGFKVKIMKRELAIVYSIYHHFKIHNFANFINFYDIILLLKNSDNLNFDLIYDIAKKIEYYDETRMVLEFCDDFINNKNLRDLSQVLNKNYKNSFAEKIGYVKGCFNKMVYLYAYLFPECKFLKSIYGENKSCLALRFSDIFSKTKSIRKKFFN